MVNSILTLPQFPIASETQIESETSNNFKTTTLNTESQQYDSQNIYVSIELIPELNNNLIKINTVDEDLQSNILNVTYFLKISHNGNIILSDFFYVQDETLILEIIPEESDKIKVSGTRQYDHNAIIVDSNTSTKISGSLLENLETMNFILN